MDIHESRPQIHINLALIFASKIEGAEKLNSAILPHSSVFSFGTRGFRHDNLKSILHLIHHDLRRKENPRH